jgi:hypothetical protein
MSVSRVVARRAAIATSYRVVVVTRPYLLTRHTSSRGRSVAHRVEQERADERRAKVRATCRERTWRYGYRL